MRSIVLDLETAPHPDAQKWAQPVTPDAEFLKPIEPDSRLKDPVKVAANLEEVERRRAAREGELAAHLAEKTAEQEDRFSLDWDMNRIAAIGFHVVGENDPEVYLCSNEFEEREHLKMLWSFYTYGRTRFITFNGHRFDLPGLIMRSLYLDVKHPELEIPAPWKTDSHVDLYQKFSVNGARDRKDVKGLRFYANRLGIPVYDDITGADVAACVKAGEWERVKNHCLFDLDLTRALAERLDVLPRITVAA